MAINVHIHAMYCKSCLQQEHFPYDLFDVAKQQKMLQCGDFNVGCLHSHIQWKGN